MENQNKSNLNSSDFIFSDSAVLIIGVEKADLEFDGLNRDIIILGQDINRMKNIITEVEQKDDEITTNITLVNKIALDQMLVRGCSSCEEKLIELTGTETKEAYCPLCGKRYVLRPTEELVRLEAREGRIGDISFIKVPYSTGVHKRLIKAQNYPYGKFHSTK